MNVFEITQLTELTKGEKLPDGRIRVTIDGKSRTFKNRAEIQKEIAKRKKKAADKIKDFKTLKKLGNWGLWRVAPALGIIEAIISAEENFFDNRDAFYKDATQAVLLYFMNKVALGLRAGTFGPKAIKALVNMNKLKKWAAGLAAGGAILSGGLSLIAGAISIGGILLIEVLIYYASDYLAEYIIKEYISSSDLEKEIQNNLFDDLAVILGLSTVDIKGSDKDTKSPDARDGKRDKDGNLITKITPLTPADIEKIKNASAEDLEKLRQKDPSYAEYIDKYIGRPKQSIRDLVRKNSPRDPKTPGIRLGFESVVEDKKDTADELDNFIDHLASKYNKSFARKAKQLLQQHLD